MKSRATLWGLEACAWAALLCVVVPGAGARGQAVIDERRVKQTLYVGADVATADDAGPGTSRTQPLKALQRAIDRSAGIDTRVVVLPGDCRESITIPAGRSLLVIEASMKGAASICGSDVFSHWTAVDGAYEHEWPHTLGPMKENHFNIDWTALQRRREQAFVNGQSYRQVMSRAELVEKTFCIDEAQHKAYVKAPAGLDIRKAKVEISVRGADAYGQGRNGAILTISDRENLVVRGMTVRHSMCGIKQSAVAGTATNVLFEDCAFDWNNGIGLDMTLKNATLRRCAGNDNGERGMGLGRSSKVVIEDCECSRNNWRFGERINGHDAAGFKAFWENREITLTRFKAVGNNASGIWFDWDNGPITIRNSVFENNRTAGINYEANRGGLAIENCVIRGNDTGLMFYGSANVTIEGCAIYGNGRKPDQWGNAGGQISLIADDRVVRAGDWSQHYLSQGYKPGADDWRCVIENYTVRNCIIEATHPTQYLFHGGTERSDITVGAAQQWCQAVKSDANSYFHPSSAKGFLNPVAKKTWEDDITQLTLEEWRRQTKQDANSAWKAADLKAVKDPTAAKR